MPAVTRLAIGAGVLWLVGFLFVPRDLFSFWVWLPVLVILGLGVALHGGAWLERWLRRR